MHYFEFATEDATLYEGEATQSVNTGMDEILEVRKDMNDTASVINVSRFLIKFDLTFISQSVVDGLIPSSANGAKYYLNLYDAGSEGLPRTHELYAYPVSHHGVLDKEHFTTILKLQRDVVGDLEQVRQPLTNG